MALSWHSSVLRVLIFISLLAESCLRAARFSSLNTAVIRKTSWQLSHLSDFPLILNTGWILLVPDAQEGSIPSSQLLPIVYAVICQLLQEGEKAINMAEGYYAYTISVAGKVQSLFQFSFDSFQRIPPKCSNILSRLCSKGAGWTVKNQSATVLAVCNGSCCKEEREQRTVPFC